MDARIARSVAPVLFAVVLMMALPTYALASAPWSAGCPDGAPTSKVCIYRDWHWEGAYGNMGGDNLSYVGETYPSSTYNVNDSISSTKNLYPTLDVRWWTDINHQGIAQCSQAGTGYYFVGSLQDNFSSHDVLGSCG